MDSTEVLVVRTACRRLVRPKLDKGTLSANEPLALAA